MCGVLSGGVATWNQALDSAFAFKTLVAFGSPLQVTNITTSVANFQLSEALLAGAIATPQGRAKRLCPLPSVTPPAGSRLFHLNPPPHDFAGQFANQVQWAANADFLFVFLFRAELEARAGGNPSWNTGVDYRKQFEKSTSKAEVIALYAAAGLSLKQIWKP